MKRELKFRAWGGERMIHFTLSDLHGSDIGELKADFYCECEDLTTIIQNENIMQFTGLKDKNGKEIYEGDILKRSNPNYGYGDPDEKDYLLYEVDDIIDFHYDYMEHCLPHDDIEVIGNIYENQELLK